jgi:hypothetical protein
VQDEVEKASQIWDGSIGRKAELLEWLIEAVHPDRRIAERLCARRIPSTVPLWFVDSTHPVYIMGALSGVMAFSICLPDCAPTAADTAR